MCYALYTVHALCTHHALTLHYALCTMHHPCFALQSLLLCCPNLTHPHTHAYTPGKNAFVKNHQLAPYEKADWKASLSDEQRWQLYDAAYESSLSLLDAATASLAELDALIYSADCCTEGGLSYDDIDLWSRLRSVTLVKGVQFPPKLQAYMDNLARLGDVPLYYSMAC
jgi:hypothetical protein